MTLRGLRSNVDASQSYLGIKEDRGGALIGVHDLLCQKFVVSQTTLLTQRIFGVFLEPQLGKSKLWPRVRVGGIHHQGFVRETVVPP